MKFLSLALKAIDVIIKDIPRLVLGVTLIMALCFGYKFYSDTQAANKKVTDLLHWKSDYEQLTPAIADLQTEYVTEQALRKKEESQWAKEKGLLQGKLDALADATFSIHDFKDHQNHPDLVTPELIAQEVHFYDRDGHQGPPFGVVSIANGTGGTVSGPYGAQLSIQAAVTTDSANHIHVTTKGFWTMTDELSLAATHPELKLKDWKGIPWPLEITGGDFSINPAATSVDASIRPKLRWAPHLNVGAFAGWSVRPEYGFHGDVSLYGYGNTKNDLDWKFLGLGVNGSKNYIDFNVMPITYRVGNWIPLASDIYAGPGVGFGVDGPVYFVGISTTL